MLHVVGDSKYGGGVAVILSIAGMARDLGFEVDVLTNEPKFIRDLERSGIGAIDLPCIWRPIRPVRDTVGLLRLIRFLRSERYDLVHTHTSKAGFVGRLAARIARVPCVVHTAHGFSFHETSSRWALAVFSRLERLAARWCDCIITVSEFHRCWAIALGIAKGAKIVAVTNGIPRARVVPTRSRDEMRHLLGVGADEFVVATIGRLEPQKGLEDLLDAVPRIVAEIGRPVRVVVAGDGSLGEELRARVAARGICKNVDFLGFRKDVGDVLVAADVVVLPSLREGLSIALLEAMAAGKPIVASDIGSNREVACEASAILVPTEAPDALAGAILALAADPERARRLGQRALARFEAEYTEDAMLAGYRTVYEGLLGLRLGHAGGAKTGGEWKAGARCG